MQDMQAVRFIIIEGLVLRGPNGGKSLGEGYGEDKGKKNVVLVLLFRENVLDIG